MSPFKRVMFIWDPLTGLPKPTGMWPLAFRIEFARMQDQAISELKRPEMRSGAVSVRIQTRYDRKDQWDAKSTQEKLSALRKARRTVAERRRKPEWTVSTADIAKEVGLKPNLINGFVLTLAGDFSGK